MISWGAAIELMVATTLASALGSVHCVGMCGPFALLATKRSDISHTVFDQLQSRLIAYHLGRLATYLSLGLLVGFASSWVRSSGFLANIGLVVGGGFVAIGFYRLWMARVFKAFESNQELTNPPKHLRWITAWGRALATLRRYFPYRSPFGNAFAWGATSTLLPCGWLYLFLMAAASAPTLGMTLATMFAFWIGTLPLMSFSAWSWQYISQGWRGSADRVASFCILFLGIYLIATRSMVGLEFEGINRPAIGSSRSIGNEQPFQWLIRNVHSAVSYCSGEAQQKEPLHEKDGSP
ncbi:MAG: sulfite exporter TauE/SafE family protein [Planctomycetes bacterium]|nr:sulfite exporter TauE/SafE family protein [Planctomycetota bacterium]